jgi:phospholipid/cholesterol/gamma-HCH transport system ATP-binding protein
MDAALPKAEIVAEGLTKSFGKRPVLIDISFTINTGEIVAIVGASGCGKTILIDHLTGLMIPDAGRVLVADHDQPARPLVDIASLDDDAFDAIRLHWQVVFQRNALFSGTVRDNLALWLREHTKMSAEDIERRSRESLQAVALDPADVLPKDRDELSGGMAKRVAIARALATDPIVMFYDEPTTGLDPVVGAHIQELIWTTHQRPLTTGSPGDRRTAVIVTHDKELLRRIEPRIIMLDEGRVIFTGSYAQFAASTNPIASAYLRLMPVLHARTEA